VQEHVIDCEWSPEGRLHAVAGPTGARALSRFCGVLDAMAEPYSRLGHKELRHITGTGYYTSAIHTPGSVLVQPAAFAPIIARPRPPRQRRASRGVAGG